METEEEYDELDTLVSSSKQKEVNPEDYILSLHVTDNLKQIFTLVLLVGNFLSVNFGLVLMCLSWYVSSSLQKEIAFLHEFYQPSVVPTMLGLSGFIMLVASVIGVKAAIGGRLMDEEGDIKSAADFLFIYSVAAAVAFGAALIAALTCFIEISVLSSALGPGLLAGMKKYISESEVKSEIDRLQMDYICCGSESYKDWFNISWVDAKHLETRNPVIQKNTKNGKYVGKDVPFSCCSWKVMRPCVDTRIEDSSYHSKYKFPDDLTLNKRGCQDAVSGFLGHRVFKSVGLFVFFCSLLWIAMAVLGRYLNTSMTYLADGEEPIGWLVPYVKPQKTSSGKPGKRALEMESEESE